MSSWVSHFRTAPASLTVLGMNAAELARNPMATAGVVHDLNADPHLPFDGASFDAVTCCVSVDYLVRPVEVFADVGRVLRPGGVFVVTFSNRCFPTKAIRGWLANDDRGRLAIVDAYFRVLGVVRGTDARALQPGCGRRPAVRGMGDARLTELAGRRRRVPGLSSPRGLAGAGRRRAAGGVP